MGAPEERLRLRLRSDEVHLHQQGGRRCALHARPDHQDRLHLRQHAQRLQERQLLLEGSGRDVLRREHDPAGNLRGLGADPQLRQCGGLLQAQRPDRHQPEQPGRARLRQQCQRKGLQEAQHLRRRADHRQAERQLHRRGHHRRQRLGARQERQQLRLHPGLKTVRLRDRAGGARRARHPPRLHGVHLRKHAGGLQFPQHFLQEPGHHVLRRAHDPAGRGRQLGEDSEQLRRGGLLQARWPDHRESQQPEHHHLRHRDRREALRQAHHIGDRAGHPQAERQIHRRRHDHRQGLAAPEERQLLRLPADRLRLH